MKTAIGIMLVILAVIAAACSEKSDSSNPTIVDEYSNGLLSTANYFVMVGTRSGSDGTLYSYIDMYVRDSNELDDLHLKINGVSIESGYLEPTDDYGYHISFLDLNQYLGYAINYGSLVSYEFSYADSIYTGSIRMPRRIVGDLPDLNPNNDFNCEWSISEDPYFFLATYENADYDHNPFADEISSKQLLSSARQYTFSKSLWQGQSLNGKKFTISAINADAYAGKVYFIVTNQISTQTYY